VADDDLRPWRVTAEVAILVWSDETVIVLAEDAEDASEKAEAELWRGDGLIEEVRVRRTDALYVLALVDARSAIRRGRSGQ